jgi:hypothetical protein
MSGNLGLTQVVASQNQKEATINAALLRLDAAISETFDANLTSGNVTVTTAEGQQCALIRAANVTTSGRTVTVPQVERVFLIANPGTSTHSVGFVRGSTTLTLNPGETLCVRTDGTANGLAAIIRGSSGDLAGEALHPGYPADNYGWLISPGTTTATGIIPATDIVYLYHFPVFRAIRVYELFIRSQNGVASSALKVGIWANNRATGRPTGTPILSNNTGLATTAANVGVTAAVTEALLLPGLYWAGSKGTAALPSVTGIGSNGIVRGVPMADLSTLASNVSGGNMSAPDAYANNIAALDLTSATFTVGGISSVPLVGARWR